MIPYPVHIPAVPSLGYPFPRIVQAVHVKDVLVRFDETLRAEGRDPKAELTAKLRAEFEGCLTVIEKTSWAGPDRPGYLPRDIAVTNLAEYLEKARKLPPRQAVEPMNPRWRG